MKNIILITFAAIFASCGSKSSEKEPLTNGVDKKAAREVQLTTQERGDTILHIVNQKIWLNNELQISKSDTIKTSKHAAASWDQDTATKSDFRKIPIYVTVD